MELVFTGTRHERNGQGVEFIGDRGGEPVRFWITRHALDALAGGEALHPLVSEFDRSIEMIWNAAQEKAVSGSTQDGLYVLRADDFIASR